MFSRQGLSYPVAIAVFHLLIFVMRHDATAILVLAFLVGSVAYGEMTSKIITAVRTKYPPVLDGFVTEAQWQTAQAALDFTQFDPIEGGLPTELTSVRMLYDDHALYVGVICYDSHPDKIVRRLIRRDRSSEADRFTVQIDSYHDLQTAFVFSTNVSGVQSDGILSQDGIVYDVTWDAVWKVQTRVFLDGWSAEFAIPYSALRFSELTGEDYVWGINFRRYIGRKGEIDEWVMVPRSERAQISKWGKVNGIREIRPPLHLNLAPYVSGQSSFQTATSAQPSHSDYDAAGGLDLKYGLTQNFTVDVTINPDFGQVEVDQAVLNLTVFETLFPEKRPFFIEGSQLFAFGTTIDNTSLPLFFSRRIGRRPSGSSTVTTPPGGLIESNPQLTTILAATKISGRTQSGFSLGAVAAATDEERATVKDREGKISTIRTEPQGVHNVLRLKQEFADNSWIGAIGTGVAKENTPPALTGGLDWNLRLGDGAYALDGYISGASSVTKRAGTAGRLLFSRISSEHWFYTTAYDFYTRFFDINDVGFFAQPHDHGGYIQLLYRENFARGMFRRYSIALNPEYRWNWDAIRTHAVVNSSFNGEFTNFWRSTLVYTYGIPSHDDGEQGIVGIYKRPATHTFQLSVQTDERQSLSASITTGYGFDTKNQTSVFASVNVDVRPVPWMELTPILFYRQTRDEETGVFSFDEGRIVTVTESGSEFSLFGHRDVDELDVALRGIATFTRALSLQFYMQVLLARGKYDDYRRLAGSTQLLPTVSPSSNYDFNLITFNANVLLRWEYLPGSTLYLVWTQARFENAGNYFLSFGRRFRDTFGLPHENVLLLKVSYWLSL